MNPAAPLFLPDEAAHLAKALNEPTAFAPIYDFYFPRVYNYVRYRVRDAQLTDDLTARIFEQVLVHLNRYRPERAPFAAWLFRIARNCVSDHFRQQKRRSWLSLDFITSRASSEAEPEEAIVAQSEHEHLLFAVANLSERERDLIALKFATGLNNRQIAQLTGLSESNVGIILYRAIHQLRALLKDEA